MTKQTSPTQKFAVPVAARDDPGAHPSFDLTSIQDAPIPVYVFDRASLRIRMANLAAQRLYGYDAEEFTHLTLYDLRPAEEIERLNRFIGQGPPARLFNAGVWRHRSRAGRVFQVNILTLQIEWEGRQAVLAILSDMTSVLFAPGSAVETGYSLFPFADGMNDAFWLCALHGDRLLYFNAAFQRMFAWTGSTGPSDREIFERIVHADDLAAFREHLQRGSQGPSSLEFRTLSADGAVRWLVSRCFPLENLMGELLLACTAEDVTRRKQREQEKIRTLEVQRDTLVREVHHRIKNSLQGVTGLLRQFAIQHPDLAPLLSEATAQVQSVAIVHGLHGRKNCHQIELLDLVRSIVASVESLMQVAIRIEPGAVGEVNRPIAEAEAVPLALILNELIFNAVKHARGAGTIRVEVAAQGPGGEVRIRISNPCPLVVDFDARLDSGNGIQLIRLLLPPAGAGLEWQQEGGEVSAVLRLGEPVLSAIRTTSDPIVKGKRDTP